MSGSPSLPGDGLTRLRLVIAYDGRGFAGWARQPGLRTVQGELERVLGRVASAPVLVTCAGRTDAGVHARGQVAHVDVPTGVDVLIGRVNRVLPEDVIVRVIDEAPPGFDARFSAIWRRYSYRVCDRPSGLDPLERGYTVPWSRQLDIDAMNAAATALLGEHDFAAFCRPRPDATTIRRLLKASWSRQDNSVVVFDVSADAFCHSMVRSLVGSLLPVGDGRQGVGFPGEVLRGQVRDSRVTVAPPFGLVLEEIGYPADADLLARQRVTRQVRTAQ